MSGVVQVKPHSTQVQALLNQVAQMIFPLALLSGWHVYSNKDWNPREIVNYLASQIINPFFVSEIVSHRTDELKKTLIPLIPDWLRNDPNFASLVRIKSLYAKVMPYLSKENRFTLENAIFIRETEYNKRFMESNTYNQATLAHQLETLEFAIKLFLPADPVVHVAAEKTALNDLLKSIDKLLVNFAPVVQERLRNEVIKRLILNLCRGSKLPLTAFCLLGNPGVGKTWFVNQLGNTANVPILHFHAEDIRPNPPDNHYLTLTHTSNKFSSDQLHPITRLMVKMREEKKSCGILFIDEVDKPLAREATGYGGGSVEQFLLNLLNADVTTYEDRYLGLRFPLTNIIIICACNKLLSEIHPRFAPIQDRLGPVLTFLDLTNTQKANIILKRAYELFKNEGIEVTEDIKRQLQAWINKDKSPGVRQLLFGLTHFITNKLCENLFTGTIWDEHARRAAAVKIQAAARGYIARNRLKASSNLNPSIQSAAPLVAYSWRQYAAQRLSTMYQGVSDPITASATGWIKQAKERLSLQA